MVKIHSLIFGFDSKFRLEIDELAVKEGEILGIIGPNGAGKTTLLHIIALHEKPRSGNIELFGREVLSSKEFVNLRREMSYVFSEPYLLKGTVYDNVALPLRLRGLRDPERVREMLELFKIEHVRNTRASQLSQGQRHRVALARAFSSRPKLVLLDEPFASLEEQYRETLIDSLRRAIKVTRSAAIFTTHDQEEALALADTIAVMREGRIVQTGSPDEIFTRPVSKEAAIFVGVRTILEGKILDKADNLCSVKTGANSIEAVSELEKDDEVYICIRPEDVVVSKQRESSSARNNFRGVITGIEPWKLAFKLNVDCGFSLVASITRQSMEDMDLKIGREVYISFKATALHLIKRDFAHDLI
ncbi:MAG: ABC transporter ATP-binding protein [Candidatus Latescibacter sp.]|nr:ABC transporter ATP-binding protein [Candidatus Latescibacter sp.]